MINHTWKNDPNKSKVKSLGYDRFQWAQDFEMELLEKNREVFLRIYNTDEEEYWLETAND